jgi:16S rRNA (guanine(966)-N(2))-methyltransferase RsmD
MRIIAGTAKNKSIKCRKGLETRPTLDRVKEALFSKIQPYVEDCRILDLFSGTGNIALEAISRGAKKAIMIEKDQEALKVIIENVNSLGFESKCRAYKNEVSRAVDILGRKGERFDIIFMDPPYSEQLCTEVIKSIEKNKILAENGLIICEHHLREKLDQEICEYKKVDEKSYGKKTLTFYTK